MNKDLMHTMNFYLILFNYIFGLTVLGIFTTYSTYIKKCWVQCTFCIHVVLQNTFCYRGGIRIRLGTCLEVRIGLNDGLR